MHDLDHRRWLCRSLRTLVCLIVLSWLPLGSLPAQSPEKDQNTPAGQPAATPAETPAPTKAGNDISLADSQQVIAVRYQQFEKTLREMAEYMRKTDPERANLLIRALGKSKEDGVARQMDKIVELLGDDQQLGAAAEMQGDVAGELQLLLDLLLSDDREKELAREKERLEAQLRELNQLISGQKEIRSGTERGQKPGDLAPRQDRLGKKADELQKNIDTKPGDKNSDSKNSDSNSAPKNPGDEQQPGDSQQTPGESPEKPEEGSDSQPMPGQQKPGQKPMPGQNQKPSGKPQPGEQQPGQEQSPQGQPPSGEQQSGESSPQQPQAQQPPGSEELQRAREAMQQALEQLKQAQREGATQAQDEAVRELERAKAKLEEILRQLREEEKKLKLEGLESRFARMLELQIQILNETVELDKIPEEDRAGRHRLRSEELAGRQGELAIDAGKALTLLQEEGQAVAFPEALEQARRDMVRVSRSLKQFEIGELTQALEKDIIETLKEMLATFQKELEKQKEEQAKPPGQPMGGQQQQGNESLVEKIAELKMLRALQVRINQRTQRIGKLISGEQANEADLIEQLRELAERQAKIQAAAYELSLKENEQ